MKSENYPACLLLATSDNRHDDLDQTDRATVFVWQFQDALSSRQHISLKISTKIIFDLSQWQQNHTVTVPDLQIKGGGGGHQDHDIRGWAPPGLSLGSATATTLARLTKKAAFSSSITTTFRGNHASVGQWICRKSITWWPVNIYTLKSRRQLVGEDKTKAIPKPGLFLTGRLSNSLELIGYLLDNVFLLLRPVFISYFVSCLNLVIW